MSIKPIFAREDFILAENNSEIFAVGKVQNFNVGFFNI